MSRVSPSHALLDSPLGPLRLHVTEHALVGLYFHGRHRGAPDPTGPAVSPGDHRVLRAAEAQLSAYFAGERRHFDLPLDLQGTPFQRSVWAALLDIPFGEQRSYGELARLLARPKASRAVGAANGANPISIVVPCHRVLSSQGELTGYAGGRDAKRRLLTLEGLHNPDLFDRR